MELWCYFICNAGWVGIKLIRVIFVILFIFRYLPFDDDPDNPQSDNINQLYSISHISCLEYILETTLLFPKHLSDSACSLIASLLVADPLQRATMKQVMSHPWVQPCAQYFMANFQSSKRFIKLY